MGWEAMAALATGAVFISLICWRDANERMSRKTNNSLLKAFVYCIFLLLTLALYLLICHWLVPELFVGKSDPSSFGKVLTIALLTFGAGSTTYFETANLKVSPYRMLLDLLMSTIPDPTPEDDLDKLRKEVRLRECTQLINSARDLREQARQDERWDKLQAEWSDLGIDYLWCELKDLNTLDEEMQQPEMALHDMRKREAELQDQILEKLDEYISSFWVKNGLTRDDRQKIVDILGVSSLVLPIKDVHSRLAGRLLQNAVVSFFLGIIFGLALLLGKDPPTRVGSFLFVNAISFAVFCTITSYAEHSRTGWKAVLGLGAIAGMIASVLLSIGLFMVRDPQTGMVRNPQTGIWEQILKYGVYGTLLAATVALLMFYARETSLFSQVRWLRSSFQRVIFFGILTGLAWMVLVNFFYLLGNSPSVDGYRYRLLRGFLVGFIAAMGVVVTSTEDSRSSNRSRLLHNG